MSQFRKPAEGLKQTVITDGRIAAKSLQDSALPEKVSVLRERHDT